MRPARALIPAVLAALIALAAQAAEIANPSWAAMPTVNQVAATHPKTIPPGGSADLACKAGPGGALSDCVVRSETPGESGLGAAALSLVPLYRVAPGQAVEGETVTFKIVWPRPSIITSPEWVSQPSPQDMIRVYPDKAIRLERSGQVFLQCQVNLEGRLANCTVVRETPAGLGFGAAALSLVPKFRMKPQTRDGAPVSGAKITVPVFFRIG